MLFSPSLKLAVLGLALVIAGCNRESGEAAQPQVASSTPAGAPATPGVLDRRNKGSELPDFTLTDQSGRTLRLAELKGKPVLINLWATWCAPCVVELPMLDKIAAEQGDALRVLTVSQDMQQTEKVAPFLAGRGATRLEPWLDPQNDLAFHYGTGTLPTTILYDAQGRELWRYVGGNDWTSAEARKLIGEAR